MNELEKKFEKKFGEGIFISPSRILDEERDIISVSPKMDIILSGGIPTGSFVLISGQPKFGKSSLALQIAGNAQKIPSKWGKRRCIYMDIEGRLKSRDISGIHNLDTDEDLFTVIRSQPGTILSAENFIEIGEAMIKQYPGCVFIFDSFSDLCTEGEMNEDIAKRYRADSPLLLARFCRRIAQSVGINDSLVIGITHLIANQGMGYSPYTESGGNKIKYRADVRLKAKRIEPWKKGDKQIGQKITWVEECSALGPPNQTDVSYLRYNHGIDEWMEWAELAIDLGYVRKSGAWLKIKVDSEAEEVNVQGVEGVANFLKENSEFFEKVKKQVNDTFFI